VIPLLSDVQPELTVTDAFTAKRKPYVILVEFAVDRDNQEHFAELIVENSRRSLADEPGCLVFDVLSRADAEFNIVLYEIYADRDAFEAHLRAPHFHAFDAAARKIVRNKQVTELSLLAPDPVRDAR
jgi:quinol monooxygenase YgiN